MRGAEGKFSEVHHEIASMLAFTYVSLGELQPYYDAAVLDAGRDEIEFMHRLLVVEREELVARGWADSTTSRGCFAQTKAEWISIKVVFAMQRGAWMPTDIRHLKYLLFRAELHCFNEQFAADIQARIQAAEAILAVSSILRRQ